MEQPQVNTSLGGEPDGGSTMTMSSYLISTALAAVTDVRVLATIVATVALILAAMGYLMRTTIDPREPPVLKPGIPIFGHAISLVYSLLNDSSGFYYRTYQANPSATMLTLPLPGDRRIYVIQNTQLMQAALRNKNMTFDPFIQEFIGGMLALPKSTYDRLMAGTESGLMSTMTGVIQHGLMGDNLRATTRTVLDIIADNLNEMEKIRMDAGVEQIALASFWVWMRQTLAGATTEALYGDFSPFRVNETLMEDLWTWDYHLPHILLAPSKLEYLLCPEGYFARESLQKAFVSYFKEGHAAHPSVSPVIRQRAITLREYGWTHEDAGLVEHTLAAGSVQNAVPTMLWLFLTILRKPEYLVRVQEEVKGLITVTKDEKTGKKTATIDVGAVEEKAPFFVACYHENVRVHKRIINTRRTTCDTELGGYLLKKGSDVMMSIQVASTHRDVWGQNTGNPKEFDPSHFLPVDMSEMDDEEQKREEELKKARKAAWIPFGGGKHLCPGRNLAFSEILGFTGVLLLGYEFWWDDDKKGNLPDIEPIKARIPADIPIPDEGGNNRLTAVRMKRRRQWEGVRWAFEV
ncbi:hypothetical protein MKZ38_008360 [Zalerion maritima]|uniref:Cytochrome P450 n=1 Tax=Zalerion maritima TaxID=339359 RepID=A0AAD5RW89_9PEZI|nr:hypothetical protein MKZ38_008360 [Zalerion maritima]